MTDIDPDMIPPLKAHGDVPADRICLRCEALFRSEGFGQRVCPRCKSSVAWKSAVPTGDSPGRRR